MKTSRLSLLLVGASIVAGATTSVDAAAFCRKTTTCNKRGSEDCNLDERGCNRSGVPLRWRRLPIQYRFSAGRPALLVREEARAAIRAAFNRWSDTLCGPDQRRTSLRFVEGEDITTDKPLERGARADDAFGIWFRDRGWPYEGTEDTDLAQTNAIFKKRSGLIDYSDIEINTGTKHFSTKDEEEGVDLQAVMTHEVGHYIGLDHSKEPLSIMTASYCEQDDRCEKGKIAARRLSQDDIDAVCTLYPPDGPAEPEPDDPDPPALSDVTGGCSTTRAPATEAGSLATVLAAFAAIVTAGMLRRRRP